MKRERYLEDLERVTVQAETKWDLERMRDAILQARANLEKRLYIVQQLEFKRRTGGN